MVVTTVSPQALARVAAEHGVPFLVMGVVGGDRLELRIAGRVVVDLPRNGCSTPGPASKRSSKGEARSYPADRLPEVMVPSRPDDDHFHDQCGLFGIFGHPEAARLTYLGLYALQHRGQESAGIVAADGDDAARREGHGPRQRHLRRRARSTRLPGDRAIGPRALLDRGRHGGRQRAADPDRLPPRADRARPQRQPRRTPPSCATSWRRRARSSSPPPTPRSSSTSTRAATASGWRTRSRPACRR